MGFFDLVSKRLSLLFEIACFSCTVTSPWRGNISPHNPTYNSTAVGPEGMEQLEHTTVICSVFSFERIGDAPRQCIISNGYGIRFCPI